VFAHWLGRDFGYRGSLKVDTVPSGFCRCSFRVRVVGDGCMYCNPEKALEYAEENAAELATRVRNWLKESAVSERITARRCRELIAICDEYSEDSAR
jgi:hypothetical protein